MKRIITRVREAIYNEFGDQIIEGWFRVSDELDTHYAETINGAVIAVYKT
jgi:hypothetical protein